MAAPKARTPKQSEAIDREINMLDLRGYSHTEIAERIGVDRSAVSHRLKRLNARALLDRTEHLTKELRTLDTALQEALDAWERSKEDSEVVTVERRTGKDRVIKRSEGQSGNPAHLANAIRVSESRRRLLGLDAPTKNIGATLTPEQLAALSDEELEALYAKLRG
jgi:DNA-binding MarR family transcriptional regulator